MQINEIHTFVIGSKHSPLTIFMHEFQGRQIINYKQYINIHGIHFVYAKLYNGGFMAFLSITIPCNVMLKAAHMIGINNEVEMRLKKR